MKQIAILMLSIICFTANAQTIKISELPEHTGNPSTAHSPIVIGGVTKKYSLGNFVFTGSTYSNPAWLTGLHPNKLLQAGATSGQVLAWNGSAFVPTTIGGALPSQSGNAGKYLTTNGTTASWATISSVSNIGNSNLRLTGNRTLSGGAGASNGYSFTYDSLASFNLTRKSNGLDYFYIGQDGEFIIKNILNESFKVDSYGGVLMQSANNAEDDMPTRVTLSAQEDTATFTFTESTKIKAEKINPNNGSAYKILVRNESSKHVEYVDAVTVDTNVLAPKAYVDYKDDIQQTFIDFRKLDVDSSLWTGYTSRARTQQIVDSIKAKDLIRDDTLTAHNAAILANQNAINTLDALTVKLAGSPTITGDKVSTGLTTARANGLAATQDLTKGLFLQNQTASTAGVPQQISPAIVWQSNAWNTGASGGGLAVGNNEFYWRAEQRATSGNGAAGTDNKLVFMQKYGTNDWVDRVEFNRDGIVAPISGNTITLGTVGASGSLTLRRSSDGGVVGSAAASSGGITFLSGSAGINVLNGTYTGFTSNPNNGMRYTNASGLYVTTTGNLSATPLSRLVVDANASIGANVAAPTNGLQVAGRTRLTGLEAEIITRTSDYTVTETDHTILVDATSGNVTITLRTAVGSKQLYNIKRIDNSGNTVTVATTSSQNIDGSTTYTGLSSQYKYVQVQANGAAYFIISNN
jgi:hypothetical protein